MDTAAATKRERERGRKEGEREKKRKGMMGRDEEREHVCLGGCK